MASGTNRREAMKRFVLTVSLLMAVVSVSIAQMCQKGLVALINSKNTPLAGVELVVTGASPAVSDANGYFELQLKNDAEGKMIQFERIHKRGYELVNLKDIETWVVSTERTYKIVMCQKGYLAESRMKFYNMGDDIYRKRYEGTISELNRLIKENRITEEQYQIRLEQAGEEYKKSKEQLDYYADKFSRMNRDELRGIDSIAILRFDSGDVNGAISVYEKADMLEKLINNVESRDQIFRNMSEIMPALVQQIQLYILSEDEQLQKKAVSIIEHLLIIYPNNKELQELKKKNKLNE